MVGVEPYELEVLRSLDEPNSLEFPHGFSYLIYQSRFNALAVAIGEVFGSPCTPDREVQDASFHGDIVIPAEITESRERVIIRVSNFGSLVTVSAGGLARDSTLAVEALHEEDRERIERVASSLGYRLISGNVLRQNYDGPTALDDWQSTWWHRFFDYM